MSSFVHILTTGTLFFLHFLFFLRACYLLKKVKPPTGRDRRLLTAAQLTLPLILITAIIRSGLESSLPGIHIISSALPFIAMFLFRKRSVRRKHPLLLPGLNTVLLAGAFLTALFL